MFESPITKLRAERLRRGWSQQQRREASSSDTTPSARVIWMRLPRNSKPFSWAPFRAQSALKMCNLLRFKAVRD